MNLAVSVRDPAGGQTHFPRVKVPPVLPRFLTLAEEGCFVPLEDVISANLQGLGEKMRPSPSSARPVARVLAQLSAARAE